MVEGASSSSPSPVASASPESQQLLYRSNEGFGLLSGLECDNHDNFQQFKGSVRQSKYSPDGKYVAFSTNQNELFVVNSVSGETVQHFEKRDVQEFLFSPLSSCICIFERYYKSDTPKNNVHIIHIASNRIIFSTLQKNLKTSVLQWTSDESHFARLVTNEIQFYKLDDLLSESATAAGGGVADGDENAVGDAAAKKAPIATRLHLENLADYSISPSKDGVIVSVFLPERKGYPASVRIYQVPNFNVPIAQKNFFKADKVDMHWNRSGSSLLAVTQTEVDQSGKSYYGESNLYLLSTRGGFDAKVTLDKEGPVHDVVWNPKGSEFVVVYGYMPSKSVMYDLKCNLIFDFGSNHRNTAKFNPQGRLLCLAGFGNLAGDMDFWDCKQLKKISSVQDNSTTYYDWSADGKHLLTATLSPRLRVDNCFKIWHYHGSVKQKKEFKELYQVGWKPFKDPELAFPMRELSPPPKGRSKSSVIEAPKPKAYIPPHQRAKMAAAAATASSKGQGKKSSVDKSSDSNGTTAAAAANAKPASEPTKEKEPLSEIAKRKKALLKKLKQVEVLKKKKAEGEPLELNQMAKIDGEADILKELKELEI